MKASHLLVFSGLLTASPSALGEVIQLGQSGNPGFTWSTLVSGGTSGGANGDISLFAANPLTIRVPVLMDKERKVVGSFDVVLAAATSQKGQTVSLAVPEKNKLLVVDRNQIPSGGDDYNINANERVLLAVSNFDFPTPDGTKAALYLRSLNTQGLNSNESLKVSLNGKVIVHKLTGTGKKGSNGSSSHKFYSEPLQEGDRFVFELNSESINYRIEDFVFELVIK